MFRPNFQPIAHVIKNAARQAAANAARQAAARATQQAAANAARQAAARAAQQAAANATRQAAANAARQAAANAASKTAANGLTQASKNAVTSLRTTPPIPPPINAIQSTIANDPLLGMHIAHGILDEIKELKEHTSKEKDKEEDQTRTSDTQKKNIRICADCHNAVTDDAISLADGTIFHRTCFNRLYSDHISR